jgi:SAM-dependent methyltransferase
MIKGEGFIPWRYRPQLAVLLRALRHVGMRVACPCCGWHFRKFLPFGVMVKRPNALCPRCGALERHRLLVLYLKNRTDIFVHPLRVLHFAPESIFLKIFGRMPLLRYVTADLSSASADVKTDITNISCKDNSVDVVLCNHVLEHVADDQKAMRELCRVLRPGGWAILQTPMDRERSKTFEDPTIVSPEARERAFGQRNHVRIYGRDYKERLEKAGFSVKVDCYFQELAPDIVKKYGLQDEEIYFCTKPLATPIMTCALAGPRHFSSTVT